MGAKLTTGGKVALAVVALGLIGFGAFKSKDSWLPLIAPGKKPQGNVSSNDFNSQGNTNPGNTSTEGGFDPTKVAKGDGKTINVGIVTWGGYAGGITANNGFAPTENSTFFKKYGYKVNLVVIDDFNASRAAFKTGSKNGGIDIVWTTVDAYALEYPQLQKAGLNPKAILQYDWSRGGDAIAVDKSINEISDLKGKKIAAAQATPSHYFGLWALAQGGVKNSEVNWVFTNSAPEAANLFKTGKVEAAVSWSPDVYVAADARGKILISTRDATHLIADVFMARGDFIKEKPGAVTAFMRGWLDGVDEAKKDPQKAIRLMAENFQGVGIEDAKGMWDDVYLPNYQENADFFGADGQKRPTGFHAIFETATNIWNRVGESSDRGNPDEAADISFLAGIKQHYASTQKSEEFKFQPIPQQKKTQKAVISKKVSVYFPPGSATLDPNAKFILDQEVAPLASTFGNAYIRIAGNTDNTGSHQVNVQLSKQRAQAVSSYLVGKYRFDRNKFEVVGHGPDKPIANNNTEDGRAKNRRTDFEVLPR